MANDSPCNPAAAQPRPLRLRGAIHHVSLRSADGRALFQDAADRRRLDRDMGNLLRRHAARAHAYCWMSNHVHLAVEIEPQHAELFQRDVATACGLPAPDSPPLVVDAQTYLLRLVRYIHLNPVEAGLVADARDYPWSGHRVYLGYAGVPWLSTDPCLPPAGRRPAVGHRGIPGLRAA
jgi:putative transposase